MSFSSFGSMIYCILCTITYINSYPIHVSCLLSCCGYTPMLYFSFNFLFSPLSVLYLFISFSYTILCTFYILYSYIYIHVLFISYIVFLYFTSCSCNCLYFHRIAVLCFSYHVISYTLHLRFHSDYRIGIHDRFDRESRHVCHSVAM